MDGGPNRSAQAQAQAQAAAQQQGRPAGQQLQNLIRPEQVARLPHLAPQAKASTEARVRQMWDYIHANQNNQSDPKYIHANQELARLSSSLMQGMKNYNAQKAAQRQREAQQQQAGTTQANQMQNQQQPQPQAQAQNTPQGPTQTQGQGQGQGQPQQNGVNRPQPQAGNSAVTFSQLLPDVQNRVNQQTFYFPPAMVENTPPADQWLQEAKARYGQAIQRAQMAKSKKNELQRAAQSRAQGGNPLTQVEQEGLASKLGQCDKAIRESQSFMEKFKEQQESFRNARAQRMAQNTATNQAVPNGAQSEGAPPSAGLQPNAPGPQAHSIASAQQAARDAASGSATAQATATPGGAPTSAGPQQTPIDQAQTPFNASTMMSQQPSRPSTSAGVPGPVHPGATMQASHAHPTSAVQTHPLNSVGGVKTHGSIPKNLNVAEPNAVNMPPSRPTLNGGANVGFSGQTAQPALTAFPGYVLEQSEDGHLLSKKKLNELVREVLGPNSEDQLTAEAEEICLSLVDDFIDDLLVSSCRLAKLRGATSLEARDVQVVLERQYNIRVPGFSTDEVRTVRKNQPAQGWAHKVGAVQAAKLMNGSGSGAAISSGATGGANDR